MAFVLVSVGLVEKTNAQFSIQIGTGAAGSSYLYAPVYTFGTTAARTVRIAYIYPSATLTGISAGQQINALEFNRITANSLALGAGNNWKIYLMNTSLNDWGSTALDWNTAITNAIKVYDGDPAPFVGNVDGWRKIDFTTNYSFNTANGSNLAILCEYIQPAGSGTPTTISFGYDNTAQISSFAANQTKYSTSTTTTPAATLSSSTSIHPAIKIHYGAAAGIDAGLASFDGITPPILPGIVPIKVKAQNFGGTTLTSFNIDWSIDGVLQSMFTYSGNLLSTKDTILNLGSLNLSAGTYTLKAWTKNPNNGATDNSALNDTITTTIRVCNPLSGIYTLDSTLPLSASNYWDFNTFFNDIKQCTTTGHVTLNVDSSTYNGRVSVVDLNLDSTKKLTINGNGSRIKYTSISTDPQGYVFGIINSNYVNVNGFTFELNSASTKGTPFYLQSSNNCIVENNIMLGDLNNTSTSYIGLNISGNSSATGSSTTSAGNIIRDNEIVGGYYSVYLNGNSSATNNAYGNIISNNIIRDFYIYGVYVNGADSTQIISNDIHRLNRISASTFYGVYLTGNSKSVSVSKNLIHDAFVNNSSVTSTTAGVYITGNDATVGREVMIVNNSIYNLATSGSNYGIYNSSSDNIKNYFNTIYFNNDQTTAGLCYGIYQITAATGIDIKNNNISISKAGSGNKYALYFSTATTTISSDYNNLYIDVNATGTGLKNIAYLSTAHVTLADWKLAASALYDQNSVSARPVFSSSTLLRPNTLALDGAGLAISNINEDITGALRSSTPDIGAYEFTPVNDDAGLMAIIDPSSICPGTNSVSVRVKNYGLSNLTSVTLNWSLNGVNQTPFIFSGSLNPAQDSIITIGTFNVSKGNIYSIIAWTSSPNGSLDANTSNDTVLKSNLTSGLLDTVTVGGIGADYPTLTALMEVLNTNGVCGPLTVDVNPAAGPYNEQLIIGNIKGASSTDTILFKGNGSVITWNSSLTSSRHTILLDGSRYVTIDSFVVYGSNSSLTTNYAWGIKVNSNSHFNTIKRNKIYVSDSTSSTNYVGIVFSGSLTSATTAGIYTYNKVLNNEINGGYYGVIIYGTSSNVQGTRGNVISNNTIRRPYYYGIYVGYQDSIYVNNNTISNPNRPILSTTNYAIYNLGSLRSTYLNNRIFDYFKGNITTSNNFYGIAFSSSDNTSGNATIVGNNEIYGIGGNGTYYGIYNSSSDGVYAYHNSINFDNPSTTTGVTYAIYQTGAASNLEYKNNSISITRGGVGLRYGMYFVTNTTAFISDYNNFYIPGGSIGYWNAVAHSTLTAWKTANPSTSYDVNSISLNPLYNSSRNLIPQINSPLVNAGTQLSAIVYDKLGNLRSTTTPFIGTYEITGDFAGPLMTSIPISNTTSTSNYTVSNVLTVSDVAGVDTSIGNRPRIYFKRQRNANTFVNNTSISNGWKYVEAVNNSSPFSFVIDYSLLDSIVMVGDLIDYFYVSKDMLGNVSIYPAQPNEDPNAINLSPNVFPVLGNNNYSIGAGISGTILVGTGQAFNSLTSASGVFNYINNNIVNGNIEIIITSDLTETGVVALDQITETGIGGYKVIIKPLGDTLRNITGSYVGGLLRLNGADRVTIDGSGTNNGRYLRISNNTTTSNNAAIQLISLGNNQGVENVTIKNSIIVAGTTGNSIGIHIGGATLPYNAGSSNKNIRIIGNNIFRGSVGIYSGGVDTAQTDSLIITDNIIGSDVTAENLRLYGMALEVSKNSRIERNIVKNIINTAAQQAWGIALYDGFTNGIIRKNNIYNISSGSGAFAGRGVELISGKQNENILIENNFIADMKGAGSNNLSSSAAVGISVRATGGVKMYYNSIHMPSQFSATTTSTNINISAGVHIGTGSSGIEMINNSISNTRLNVGDTSYAYAMYSDVGDTSYLTVNYNNYYVNQIQGVLAYYPSVGNVIDLASLKFVTAKNSNSVNNNPNYKSNTDLHAQGVGLYQKGTNITGVTTDIDDELRSSTVPSIGADEFSLPPVDIKVVEVIYPNNYHCGPSSDSIKFVIENFGTSTQTGFTVKANLSKAVIANISKTYTRNLLVGMRDTVSVGYYNANVNDTLVITAIVDATGDADRLNDTLRTNRILLPTPNAPTIVSNNPTCIGSSATIVASSNASNILWYNTPVGGTPITNNDTLITPALTGNTTYYVEATNNTIVTSIAGRPNPLATSSTYSYFANYGLVFDVSQEFTLDKVDVYHTGTTVGSITVALQNSAGQILMQAPAQALNIGTGTTFGGGATPTTITLNFTIPPGTGYRLVDIARTGSIIRDNPVGSNFTFPLPIGNVGQIQGGLLGGSLSTNTYYYFYNWQIKQGQKGCSSSRVPVPVNLLPRPSGSNIVQSTPYQGVFNAGTLANADEACLADTLTYALTPPTGFTAAGLGTTWAITNATLKTLSGVTAAGSVTYNGLNMTYVAATGDLDSTLMFSAKVVNLSTGCDSDVVRYLKVNKAPVVSLGTDLTICDGTPTVIDAANPGSTYLWSTGDTTQTITVSTAGTYSVMVTNTSGCSSYDTIVVNTNPSPVQALGADIQACVGQNVVLDAGNPNATYSWNTGATTRTINPVVGGTYIVTVTGTGGCSTSDTIEVVFNSLPVVDIGADINICIEDTTVLDAGNPGSTYLWSTGDTTQTIKVNAAGTYSVTVTNANGCSNTDQMVVTNKPAPNASFTDTALNGLNVKFTSIVTAGNSYTWNFGDPTSATNTSALPSPIHEFTSPGTYTVTLTVTNVASGCVTVEKRTITVAFVGISTANKEVFNFYAAPNPYAGSTNLNFNLKKTSMVKIEMFDLLGRKVKTVQDLTELPIGDHKVELVNTNAELPNGVYLIKLNVDGNESVIRVQDNTSK